MNLENDLCRVKARATNLLGYHGEALLIQPPTLVPNVELQGGVWYSGSSHFTGRGYTR